MSNPIIQAIGDGSDNLWMLPIIGGTSVAGGLRWISKHISLNDIEKRILPYVFFGSAGLALSVYAINKVVKAYGVPNREKNATKSRYIKKTPPVQENFIIIKYIRIALWSNDFMKNIRELEGRNYDDPMMRNFKNYDLAYHSGLDDENFDTVPLHRNATLYIRMFYDILLQIQKIEAGEENSVDDPNAQVASWCHGVRTFLCKYMCRIDRSQETGFNYCYTAETYPIDIISFDRIKKAFETLIAIDIDLLEHEENEDYVCPGLLRIQEYERHLGKPPEPVVESKWERPSEFIILNYIRIALRSRDMIEIPHDFEGRKYDDPFLQYFKDYDELRQTNLDDEELEYIIFTKTTVLYIEMFKQIFDEVMKIKGGEKDPADKDAEDSNWCRQIRLIICKYMCMIDQSHEKGSRHCHKVDMYPMGLVSFQRVEKAFKKLMMRDDFLKFDDDHSISWQHLQLIQFFEGRQTDLNFYFIDNKRNLNYKTNQETRNFEYLRRRRANLKKSI